MKLFEVLTDDVSLELLSEALGFLFELDTSPEAEERFNQQADALVRLVRKIDRGKFQDIQNHPVVQLFARHGLTSQGEVKRALTSKIQEFRAEVTNIHQARKEEERIRDRQAFDDNIASMMQDRRDRIDAKKQKAERSKAKREELGIGEVAGYWVMAESASGRVWKPIFGSPAGNREALFPFNTHMNVENAATGIVSYQAYDFLPGRAIGKLKGEEKQLFNGLMDAMKGNSTEDVIRDQDFKELMDRTIQVLITKSDVDQVPSKDIFIMTPPTGAERVKEFAVAIQQRLGVPEQQVLVDKLGKRSARAVLADVEADTKMPPKAREAVIKSIKSAYRNDLDQPFQIKKIGWKAQGNRSKMLDAGIEIFDVVDDFNIGEHKEPILIIADDRKSSGVTNKETLRIFKAWTNGTTPAKTYSFTMFRR